jgi:long-chain acyl-CoA synthetase
VVGVETALGPEACAVLVVRGDEKEAAEAVERANVRLADFQRVRRWLVWPEPDLPRTSTGKVRRKPVAEWVASRSAASLENGVGRAQGLQAREARGDWLYGLLAKIAGEYPEGGDELRLNEDFHLDSLGRVQLAAALEERMTDAPKEGSVDAARTLGELRQIVGAALGRESAVQVSGLRQEKAVEDGGVPANEPLHQGEQIVSSGPTSERARDERMSASMVSQRREKVPEKAGFVYPQWPWSRPMQWIRSGFLELIAQPFVWFLGDPRVVRECKLDGGEPMLIICNHVTAYDGALVEYALPGRIRRRVASAMLGEMLEDFRHFRDPDSGRFMLFGPAAYWLLTALYNVFPLPRRRDFQRSFAHAGEALDRGYNVLVFPEGTRSAVGELAPFRPGIGLLVKQAHAPVLPVALIGLGELKAKGRGWFRSGKIEVRVGRPLRFGALLTEAEITEQLHSGVAALMSRSR